MEFEGMSEEELLSVNRRQLTHECREKLIRAMVRKILWQDIVAKGPDYRMLAISVCRYQDGYGLREAADRVDGEYYRQSKAT